jgi:hypothetical protein
MTHHRVVNLRRVYLRDVLAFAKKRDKEGWLRWTSWHAMKTFFRSLSTGGIRALCQDGDFFCRTPPAATKFTLP